MFEQSGQNYLFFNFTENGFNESFLKYALLIAQMKFCYFYFNHFQRKLHFKANLGVEGGLSCSLK